MLLKKNLQKSKIQNAGNKGTKCFYHKNIILNKGLFKFKNNLGLHFRNIRHQVKSGSLSTEQYKKIKAVGSRPGILYGLCKVHKAITDVCPPFRPILSAIGTPSYKLAKLLVPKLSRVTSNEFTLKDSFAFAEEIVHEDSKLFMGTLDVDSFFTNIPLEETINICTNLLYNNEDVIEGINKSEFKNLLSLAIQESYLIFNYVLYKQNDGVAIGSPLGPTMANVFL